MGIDVRSNVVLFDGFWERARTLSPSEAYERFLAEIVPTFPEFYAYKLRGWMDPTSKLSESLREYSQYRESFLALGSGLPEYLSKSLVSFREAFSGFDLRIPAYIIHSFDEMDGGTRVLDGKLHFIFGAESIAKYHRSRELEGKIPFLHHELFHVFHSEHFMEGESLLDGL